MRRDIELVHPELITVGQRHRALSSERVDALAASMNEIGLKTPISIIVKDDDPILVAGHHRLQAAIKLGWDHIECLVLEGDDVEAQLWEIDENLARSELTTDEKREHLRRRKAFWEARQMEMGGASCATQVDAIGRKKSPQQQKSFAADTATSTGLSKSQINRLLAEPKPKPKPKPESRTAEEEVNRDAEKWDAAEKLAAAVVASVGDVPELRQLLEIVSGWDLIQQIKYLLNKADNHSTAARRRVPKMEANNV